MLHAETQYLAASSNAVCFDLEGSLVFRATGEDRVRYLHSRLTQDIQSLPNHCACDSLMLSPRGSIEGLFSVLKYEDSILLISASPGGTAQQPTFLEDLLRFKVADQLEITSEDYSLSLLLGPKTLLLENHGWPVAPFNHMPSGFKGLEIQTLFRPLNNIPAYILIFPSQQKTSLKKVLADALPEIVFGAIEGYELFRIAAGIPQFGVDLTSKILATEIDTSMLISFEKGCYTGQEAVEMSLARGRPNRVFCQFTASSQKLSSGGEIRNEAGDRCGTLTSCAYYPSEGLSRALGFLQTKVSQRSEFFCNNIPLKRLPS